jgi:hypothetical protein
MRMYVCTCISYATIFYATGDKFTSLQGISRFHSGNTHTHTHTYPHVNKMRMYLYTCILYANIFYATETNLPRCKEPRDPTQETFLGMCSVFHPSQASCMYVCLCCVRFFTCHKLPICMCVCAHICMPDNIFVCWCGNLLVCAEIHTHVHTHTHTIAMTERCV